MARFVANQPIRTAEPTVVVDAGLPLGEHRFQLVVTDSAGNDRRPAIVTVQIVRAVSPRPTDPPR